MINFLKDIIPTDEILNPIKNLRKKTDTKKDSADYKPLEHYGIIGNMETVALIAKDGSIDWMCLPHLESKSVFASILDKNKGGFFQISPRQQYTSNQEYEGHTNILKTNFHSSSGSGQVIDFMPPFKKSKLWHKQQILFRQVKCTKGYMPFKLTFYPRFDYGKFNSNITKTETGIVAKFKEEHIYLDTLLSFDINHSKAESNFTLSENEELWIVMQYGIRKHFTPKEIKNHYKETFDFWEKWRHKCDKKQCVFNGPWHDLVIRSGLVLKLLTHGETGSIAAAATTSLPEEIEGIRNWDYRFNWIRDSVFTVQSLYNLGNKKEARLLFNWYKKLYKGIKISDIQIMYGMHGEKDLTEKILRYLSGYKNSKPVRIGNLASSQVQLDIYGEILNMAFETSNYGESLSKNDWQSLTKIVNHVCQVWNTKDSGIWEVRGGKQHFVYSKLMCWVAVDRGLKIAEKRQFKAPTQKWEKTRNEIRESILQNGYDKTINSFVQSYNSKSLDAANLIIPIVGFLPFEDERVKGTIKATLENLTKDGLVFRYISEDGLKGAEGAFVLCTFWLIDCLALSGQVKEAEKMFLNLMKYATPLGLFSEEIDTSHKILLGNFPQAFSHVGLINSAMYIGLSKGKQVSGPNPLGTIGNKIITLLRLRRILNKE